MSTGKTNIIVVSKNKLIAIDAVLPLLMELNARYENLSFWIIAVDKENQELINRQYNIIECLKSINAQVLFQPRDSRWKLYGWTIILFLKLLFKRNIFFSGGACLFKHDNFIAILKKLSSTTEFRYSFLTPLPHFVENLEIHQKYMRELTGEEFDNKPTKKMKYDYFLSSMPYDALRFITPDIIPESKFIELGYLRSLPEWLKFARSAADEWRKSHKEDYCLFILSTFAKRINIYDEPPLLELFRETLEVLKEFSQEIHIVFKPHAITDMEIFEKEVKAIGLTNYSVDYGHPMVLSYFAKFIIGNCYSNTMYEAFYLDCPVVEYSYYDPGLLKRMNNKSSGGDCCDFFIQRDKAELREAVGKILKPEAKATSSKKHIKKYFEEKTAEFFKMLNSLIK